MAKELKSIHGLGFHFSRIEDDEIDDIPCVFHKLDEESEGYPCPETPYVFVSAAGEAFGYSFCGRHFAQFAGDMHMALTEIARGLEGVEGVEPIDTNPKAMFKDGGLVTSAAFYELVMETKAKINGRNR